ncbi:MAG: type II toxin-antitoxin system YafQ family toxin [Candidatus Liptonbacteria bacterium]|nr:type II toxin-antitoxin system YafQ family toxin [Candidatus Liptonbacteria bacterium]
MVRLIASHRFKKHLGRFLKKHPELEADVEEKLKVLQKNPRDPRLRSHKLTGRMSNCFAIWITYEHRIILSFKESSIFLLAIGTHDEVY